jgi:glutaminyl-peptide cyclotransferase
MISTDPGTPVIAPLFHAMNGRSATDPGTPVIAPLFHAMNGRSATDPGTPVIASSPSVNPPELVILSAAKNPRISLLLLLVLLLSPHPALAQKAAPANQVTGQAIYTLTQQLLAVAPKRFNGSPGHLAAENFIKDHFKPEAAKGNFETDQFTATTPVGPQVMRNFIVRYPGKRDGVIVLATHYETNYWLRDIAFVGANDGACTTALLIALGQYFRAHPPQGYSIWLVFDDGEESTRPVWEGNDNLYGTRHLAAKWYADGTLNRIKAFLLADMIGDKDLNIDRDDQSTPWLEAMLAQAAKNTGHSANVFKNPVQGLGDDHIPFKQRGVPVLDLIDIDYGPHTNALPDGYHHTAQDTIDKISPKSLQISADLFLEMIRLLNQR